MHLCYLIFNLYNNCMQSVLILFPFKDKEMETLRHLIICLCSHGREETERGHEPRIEPQTPYYLASTDAP